MLPAFTTDDVLPSGDYPLTLHKASRDREESMIRNEHEYQKAQELYRKDHEVTENQRQALVAAGLAPEEVATAMEPLLSFQEQLTEKITWYENVRRHNFSPATRLTQIGRLLIALRIASGMSQRELAARLSVSEAAVSRDERNEYHGITLERAQRVLDALEASMSTTIDGIRTWDRRDRKGSPDEVPTAL